METFLSSNSHSAIITALDKKANDALQYSTERAIGYPGQLARSKVMIDCQSYAQNFGTFNVNIPKYGLLEKLAFRFSLTVTTAHELSGNIGMQVFDKVELVNNAGVILNTLHPDVSYTKSRSTEENFDAKGQVLYGGIAKLAGLANGATTGPVYYVLDMPFFAKPSMWLDTHVAEQLSVRFSCRPFTAFSKSATAAIMSAASLICYFRKPTSEMHQALVARQHTNGEFNMTIRDTFFEGRLASPGGITTVDLSCDSPVTKTYVLVRTVANVDTEKDHSALQEVTRLRFQNSGNLLMDSLQNELVCLENIPQQIDLRVYCIDWGSYDDSGDTTAVSFHEMSNPQLLIDHAVAASYVYVYHDTIKLLQRKSTASGLDMPWLPLSDK